MIFKRTKKYQILIFLFESKGASMAQIANRLFNGEKSSYLRNLLSDLTKQKLVVSVKEPVEYRFHRYYLTVKGAKFLSLKEANIKLKSEKVIHDDTLTDVRETFEKLKVCESYFTENMIASPPHLQGQLKVNPDAIAVLNKNGQSFTCAAELELSTKSKSRYALFFQKYEMEERLDHLIIISDCYKRAALLQEIQKRDFPKLKKTVLYIHLSELLFHDKFICFSTATGELLKLELKQEGDKMVTDASNLSQNKWLKPLESKPFKNNTNLTVSKDTPLKERPCKR